MRIIDSRCKHSSGRATKMRIYFWPVGETILENVQNRRGRPYNEFRKMIPEILRRHQFDEHAIHTAHPKWSQKAGCSCGCSPGFIIDGIQFSNKVIHVDVSL